MGSREDTLLVAMRAYSARFGRPDVNLIDAIGSRKSASQLAVERSVRPWAVPETHRPSSTVSHLRSMGYRGDEGTLEADVRMLERRGDAKRTGSASWSVSPGTGSGTS